ncbi:MAG: hypothetical protein PHS47_03175 [Methanocellales archaeon]|nr:hypothetical protein [Methanocellales archaeon]MDD5446743.1 hypothetical protein [Methanocellales archaeon]
MKKIIVIGLMAIFVINLFCGNVMASSQSGPAPNSGDCNPDGSGMDNPFQNGDPDVDCPGPAPNSGDGIPDESGF